METNGTTVNKKKGKKKKAVALQRQWLKCTERKEKIEKMLVKNH